jgi:hypothetical protein
MEPDMTSIDQVKVKYYSPLFMRGEGWYFIIPANDAESEGDLIAGMFSCKETCNAAIRGCTDTIPAHNDNVEAKDVQ